MTRRVGILGALCAFACLATAAAVASAAPPAISSAVAVSLKDVRVYFNERVDPGSVQPSDFALSMADSDHAVTAATVAPDGLTATISSSSSWFNGEAGSIHLTAPEAINSSAGEPSASTDPVKVGAAPGDFIPPTVSGLRLTRGSIRCWCGGSVGIVFNTSQDASRGFLTVYRGGRKIGVRRILARPGRNNYHWDGRINGRLLNHGTFRLQITVVDLVGNETPRNRAPSRKLRVG
jgi:hypothetical protein